jgi:Na+-translocating ferredoxin:NAD+ oxidoreductase subunit G
MAGKRESNFFNMVSTLLLVTALSAFALGSVYNLTKGPIEMAKQKKQEEAIKQVLPEFERLETINVKSAFEEDSLQFNVAYVADEIVGVAVNTYTKKGFSGLIRLMVGFLPDGTINNVSVLDHKETPGLGDKMQKSKSEWSNQFNGKNPGANNIKMKKDGGEIDAITAATISSRAYSDAVMHAFETYELHKGGN